MGHSSVLRNSVDLPQRWGLGHITSSPRYPQSNGKAENAVKTVKRLFTKCAESGQSEIRALLDWRNTPTEGMDTSPAQRFLGRRCKALLPTNTTLLQPCFETTEDKQALNRLKDKQKFYYNHQAKPLTPLSAGETVHMQLPGEKTWTPGVCMGQRGPRSYKVKVGDQEYRCNRRQLIQTNEPPPLPDIQTTPNCSRSFETTPETNRGDTLETTPTQDSGTTSVKLNSEKARLV